MGLYDVVDNNAFRAAGLQGGDRATSLNLNCPCVQAYLQQNYGGTIANTIPSMSLLSLDPRSGARDAYVKATAEAIGIKGSAVGAVKACEVGAKAAGLSKAAQVLGGALFGIEVAAGLVTGYSIFATTAHAMAAGACSC